MNEINKLLNEIEKKIDTEDYNSLSILRGKLAIMLARQSTLLAETEREYSRKWLEIRSGMQNTPDKKISVAEVDRLLGSEEISQKRDYYRTLFDYSLQVLRALNQRINVLLAEKGISKYFDVGGE